MRFILVCILFYAAEGHSTLMRRENRSPRHQLAVMGRDHSAMRMVGRGREACSHDAIISCGDTHCGGGCAGNYDTCIGQLGCLSSIVAQAEQCGSLHCDSGCASNFQSCVNQISLEAPTYVEGEITNADYTGYSPLVRYSTEADAQVACNGDAACLGIWQGIGDSTEWVKLQSVSGGRTWRQGVPNDSVMSVKVKQTQASAYTCVTGQVQSGGSRLFETSDNSYESCASLCSSTAGCVGFDYTTNSQSGACRGVGTGQTPRSDGGSDARQYCTQATTTGNAADVCLTIGSVGVGSGQPCVFPFIHNGVTHSTCTTYGHDSNWCSTQTDSSDNHIFGQWGECGPACPMEVAPQHYNEFHCAIRAKCVEDLLLVASDFVSFQCECIDEHYQDYLEDGVWPNQTKQSCKDLIACLHNQHSMADRLTVSIARALGQQSGNGAGLIEGQNELNGGHGLSAAQGPASEECFQPSNWTFSALVECNCLMDLIVQCGDALVDDTVDCLFDHACQHGNVCADWKAANCPHIASHSMLQMRAAGGMGQTLLQQLFPTRDEAIEEISQLNAEISRLQAELTTRNKELMSLRSVPASREDGSADGFSLDETTVGKCTSD